MIDIIMFIKVNCDFMLNFIWNFQKTLMYFQSFENLKKKMKLKNIFKIKTHSKL